MVASLTLIVGTGAVVIRSIGGSTQLSPFSLGVFFLGMSLISLCTHWIFEWGGRKKGLVVGSFIACVGVALGCVGLFQQSPAIVLLANCFCGAGTGIGMYLRFVAMEVLDDKDESRHLYYSSRAVTWTLCGGCLAAFCGPEAAHATKGMLGTEDDHLLYLGVFVVAGCFYVAQAIFVSFIAFPSSTSTASPNSSSSSSSSTSLNRKTMPETPEMNMPPSILDFTIDHEVELGSIAKRNPQDQDSSSHTEGIESDTKDLFLSKRQGQQPKTYGSFSKNHENATRHTTTTEAGLLSTELKSILQHPDFWIPLLIAILSWAIMAMPMSIFRLTMSELGYSERQSLTVIEFHFLAMYIPGFYSGNFIQRWGCRKSSRVAFFCFVGAIITNLNSKSNNTTIVTWYIGLILLGFGWNFGYSAATVWVSQAYKNASHLKPNVQAANEFATFLISGAAIFSTGYIYENVGGGGIQGWKLLNYTLLGLVAVLGVVIGIAVLRSSPNKT